MVEKSHGFSVISTRGVLPRNDINEIRQSPQDSHYINEN